MTFSDLLLTGVFGGLIVAIWTASEGHSKISYLKDAKPETRAYCENKVKKEYFSTSELVALEDCIKIENALEKQKTTQDDKRKSLN